MEDAEYKVLYVEVSQVEQTILAMDREGWEKIGENMVGLGGVFNAKQLPKVELVFKRYNIDWLQQEFS